MELRKLLKKFYAAVMAKKSIAGGIIKAVKRR